MLAESYLIRGLIISNHAIKRYISRFSINLMTMCKEEQRARAINGLKIAYENSVVLSEEGGVIIRHSDILHADLIIRDGVLVTVFPAKKEIKKNGRQLRCRKAKRNLTRHYFLARKRGGYDLD